MTEELKTTLSILCEMNTSHICEVQLCFLSYAQDRLWLSLGASVIPIVSEVHKYL